MTLPLDGPTSCGNHATMRAYLAGVIGDATFQEKREGQGDLRFDARSLSVNTGNTQGSADGTECGQVSSCRYKYPICNILRVSLMGRIF